MRNSGSKLSILQMRKLRPRKMKVNYPRSRSQSGSEPERNRAHSGRGCPTTSGLGLGQMCPAPVVALKSGPGSAAWGSPLCKKSPPPATGSQKPLESSSHAQHAEKGAQRRPEEAGRDRGAHPRPERSAEAAAQPRARAAQVVAPARLHEPAHRHRGAPGPAPTHPATPPPPPRNAEGRGRRRPSAPQPSAPPRAPRLPSAPRATLLGPAPGPGRPRAVTPPVGAARRARFGAKREGFSPRGARRSRAGSVLSSAGLSPGTPRSASVLANHVQRF